MYTFVLDCQKTLFFAFFGTNQMRPDDTNDIGLNVIDVSFQSREQTHVGSLEVKTIVSNPNPLSDDQCCYHAATCQVRPCPLNVSIHACSIY